MSGDREELLEGWVCAPLGEVVQPSRAKIDPTTVPDEPYIGLEHVEAHSMRLLSHGVARDVKSAKSVFNAGDVLYGKLRPYLNKVVRPEFGGVCSTDFLVFGESDHIDPGYLAHYLNQLWVSDQAHHLSAGVELPRVDWSSLSQLPISYPPSKEDQRAIVAQIEHIGALRRSAVLHLAVARSAIERFRQAVLAAACCGRLTANWREGHPDIESADAVIERSKTALVAGARRQRDAERIGNPDWIELPASWRWALLSELAEIRGGIQKQPKRAPRSNAYPYLRVANVLRDRLDLTEISQFELFPGELDAYCLLPGDLLVVEGNGSASEIGRSALWHGEIPDCVHQNHIIRVRCVEAVPRFVDLYWNSPIGSREISALAVTSAGLYSLSTKKIGSVPVPIPPIEEQVEIVRRVDQLLAVADRLQQRVEAALRRVERSSQAVLAKAFRGELVTSEVLSGRGDGPP